MGKVEARWMRNGKHRAHLFPIAKGQVLETDTGEISLCGTAYSGDNPGPAYEGKRRCKLCEKIESEHGTRKGTGPWH